MTSTDTDTTTLPDAGEASASTPWRGIDYAFSPHPAIGELLPGGIRFVMRYTSPLASNDHNGKNLVPAEKQQLLAAGLAIGIVFESGSGRVLGGHAAGVLDAEHANAVVKALGMAGLPVYFACDFDIQHAQLPVLGAYLDGAASVIGQARTGVYGGITAVRYALDHGHAHWAWQTYAWSGTPTSWDPRAHVRQFRNGVHVAGATVDMNEAMRGDFGQWPRPHADQGPFRHVVPHGDRLSIDAVADHRGTTVAHIADESRPRLDAEHRAVFDAYMDLRAALAKLRAAPPAMPGGMAYYTSHA